MNDLINSDMWDRLVEAVKCYDPAEYKIDFLDDLDGQCVVNVVVDNKDIYLDTAIEKGYKLGKIVETILNQYDSDNIKKWFLYDEENFFDNDGEECYEEWIEYNGGIVQHIIIKEGIR